MDPISILVHAATALGGAMMNETAKRAVGQAWDSAITAIRQRLGADHPAPALAEKLLLAGSSESAAGPLREQLAQIHLAPDPEILAALQPLLAALAQQGLGAPQVHAGVIKGAGIVMGDQTVNFND